MPELPEVETVVRGLRPRLEGHRFVAVEQRRADLRVPLPEGFAARLRDRYVVAVRRRAKYMLVELDDGQVVLGHLGMSGRLTVLAPENAGRPLDPHDHIVLTLDDRYQIRFNDPRRFGLFDLVPGEELEQHRLLRDLGPEPLGNAFNGPALAARLAGRRAPIKAALLDQRVVAGLGNIYVCESLYHAGLSPRRLARSVQGARAERLAAAIREVLGQAIAAGGSSLRNYMQTDGELGYFQHQWAVYGRAGEVCPACLAADTGGCTIRRLVQSNRSTFYCARRQR